MMSSIKTTQIPYHGSLCRSSQIISDHTIDDQPRVHCFKVRYLLCIAPSGHTRSFCPPPYANHEYVKSQYLSNNFPSTHFIPQTLVTRHPGDDKENIGTAQGKSALSSKVGNLRMCNAAISRA